MFQVVNSKCNGCGECIEVCRQKAIFIMNSLAEINQRLCIQCGACSKVCLVGAIKETVSVYTFSWKGGNTMRYECGRGFARGIGHRGGGGFGFRGASPPPPYNGRGRGGLPRCWYPGLALASPYESAASFNPSRRNREDELDRLKSQSEAIKAELSRVEARINDLETGV